MSWVDGIKAVLGWPALDAGTIENSGNRPQTPLPQITTNSATWGDFFGGVPGLPLVSETTAQSITAVYACVNLIAGAISAMSLNLYTRAADGERTQVHNDDLWWVLNEEMLPRWGAANGWEFLGLNLLFHGNAYAIIKRHPVTARPIGMEPVHCHRVSVIPSADGMRLIYTVAADMRVPGSLPGVKVYDQDDMIDVAGFGFDGWRGLSPLKYHLSMAGGVALATQEYAARFFTNGARPDLVVTSDAAINAETAERIQQGFADKHVGYQNAHKPMVLGNGAKVTAVQMSGEDAQLLDTRRFQVEEICRIYGVPPFMIGHLEKTTSWGNGVASMGQGFVRFTLRQHLSKIEREINRKFFRTKGKFVEFDTFELEKADMTALFTGFATALGQGGGMPFMSTDEVRLKLNLRRTPGGDVLPARSTTAAKPQEGKDAPEPTA